MEGCRTKNGVFAEEWGCVCCDLFGVIGDGRVGGVVSGL